MVFWTNKCQPKFMKVGALRFSGPDRYEAASLQQYDFARKPWPAQHQGLEHALLHSSLGLQSSCATDILLILKKRKANIKRSGQSNTCFSSNSCMNGGQMLLPRAPYSFRLPLHLTVCSCEICGKSPALLLSRVIPSDLHMIPTPTPRQNPAQRETGTTPAIHNKMAGTAGQHFHIRHTMIWTPTPYLLCYKSQKQLRHKHCNASRNEAWAPKWSSRLTTRCHWKKKHFGTARILSMALCWSTWFLENLIFQNVAVKEQYC